MRMFPFMVWSDWKGYNMRLYGCDMLMLFVVVRYDIKWLEWNNMSNEILIICWFIKSLVN
jgi:hypothetical protein